MAIKAGESGGLKKRHLILFLVLWWILVLVAYMAISLRVKEMTAGIIRTGTSMARELSGRINLPLLERDMPSLSQVLNDAAVKSGLVYATVFDHKNKIIAYTDPDRLLPDKRKDMATIGPVTYWTESAAGREASIAFSSDIIFSGTKIGEIRLGLSGAKIDRYRSVFAYAAAASFVGLLAVLMLIYHRGIGNFGRVLRMRMRPGPPIAAGVPAAARVACPLCGSQRPFARDIFTAVNLDRFQMIQVPESNPGGVGSNTSGGIRLSEIAARQDLGWLKRQIILRCVEIIGKLSA